MIERVKKLLRKIKIFFYKSMRERTYLKIFYFVRQHGVLHFDKPRRLSEKLFYLKVYYRTRKDLIQEVYDKYTARDYVKKKAGSQYLSKLFGVYDSVDEIDFDSLPDKFALKVTQSCGCNLFCSDRENFHIGETKRQMSEWLQEMNSERVQIETEEGYYHNGNAKIICEEYLEDSHGAIPLDVRFWCFNGKVKFYCMDFDTVDEKGNKKKFYYRNTYDVDGELIPVDLGRPHNTVFARPDLPHFEEMLKLAETLAEDFAFVRVDLYNIDGRIVFGELTPIPQSGSGRITPKKYDYLFGEMLKLPDVDFRELLR